MEWAQGNKYFHLLSRGVERDGWRFVLLARFSPIPSYVINYALAATKVGFILDFLLPSVIGCLPMILQNTSIGSLAGAAVATASGSQKSQVWSYVFPLLGIVSSILISLRIKKYSTDISVIQSSSSEDIHDCNNTVESSQTLSRKGNKNMEKSHWQSDVFVKFIISHFVTRYTNTHREHRCLLSQVPSWYTLHQSDIISMGLHFCASV